MLWPESYCDSCDTWKPTVTTRQSTSGKFSSPQSHLTVACRLRSQIQPMPFLILTRRSIQEKLNLFLSPLLEVRWTGPRSSEVCAPPGLLAQSSVSWSFPKIWFGEGKPWPCLLESMSSKHLSTGVWGTKKISHFGSGKASDSYDVMRPSQSTQRKSSQRKL